MTQTPLSSLQLVGYECDRCTRKSKEYVIVKDYRQHLKTIHKIPETHIPSRLEGSAWEEEFVAVYSTDLKCHRKDCKKPLLGFQYEHEGQKDFLQLNCLSRDDNAHLHHNGRIFIGKQKKFFCERHGHNSDKQGCMFCEVEGSFSNLFS